MSEQRPHSQRIGRYELEELIEQGVSGAVHRARDLETGESVLLKVFPASVSGNPAFARYFYDKWADHRSVVKHPNVLEVRDIGREGDLHYVVIHDAGGERLSRQLAGAPLPLDVGLNILRQAAEGLRAAHRRGAVHGHLKPSDIVLTENETGEPLVKVAFLDLATSPSEGMVSVFGELMGTPKYMAPEVIQGRLPSEQSDIFSLGVIAYEIFSGNEPFPADHAVGYLFANCQQQPMPLDEANPEVPRELALVIARMLEKEPNKRYRSMQRAVDDLDRCVECIRTGRVEVVPYGTDSAFARDYELPAPAKVQPQHRRPWLSYAVLSVAIIALIGLAVYGLVYRRDGASLPTDYAPGPATEEVSPLAGEPGARHAGTTTGVTVGATQTARPADIGSVMRDVERYVQRGDYQLAVTALEEARNRLDGKAPTEDIARELAQVHAEWAHALTSAGDFANAANQYKRALAVAPAGSRYAELARAKLPETLVQWAEDAKARGDYKQALHLYKRIADEYPGTLEAGLLRTREPELLLNAGHAQWREEADYSQAIATFTQLIENYPNTRWADTARNALPEVYLEAVQEAVAARDYPSARRRLRQLVEAYPEHSAAERAKALDAELLHGLYEEAAQREDEPAADQYFAELLTSYVNTPWAVRAARRELGLEPRPGEATYGRSAARAELKNARQRYDEFDYGRALGALEGVVRYADAESVEATEALALLPAWRYEQALHLYGSGNPVEFRRRLAAVAEAFRETRWAAAAESTLRNVENAPQGMAFVPEGRFAMGTDLSQVEEIIREHNLSPLPDDPEATRMAAEFYGLLNEVPQHDASTGAYFIDKTEVSNAQYARFVEATGYPAPAHWEDGSYPDGEADLPVVNVSLRDAQRFAEWRNCRLPTEQEWEKAARGTDGRRFPWGPMFGQNRSRHMLPADVGPAPVGSYPNWESPYGVLDVIGNVQEWTSSNFAPYPNSPLETLEAEDGKVTRGGSWQQQELAPIPSSCTSRYPWDPEEPDMTLGFRCVQDIGDTTTESGAEAR